MRPDGQKERTVRPPRQPERAVQFAARSKHPVNPAASATDFFPWAASKQRRLLAVDSAGIYYSPPSISRQGYFFLLFLLYGTFPSGPARPPRLHFCVFPAAQLTRYSSYGKLTQRKRTPLRALSPLFALYCSPFFRFLPHASAVGPAVDAPTAVFSFFLREVSL